MKRQRERDFISTSAWAGEAPALLGTSGVRRGSDGQIRRAPSSISLSLIAPRQAESHGESIAW